MSFTWSYIFCIFLHFLSIQTTVSNLEIDWIANRDWQYLDSKIDRNAPFGEEIIEYFRVNRDRGFLCCNQTLQRFTAWVLHQASARWKWAESPAQFLNCWAVSWVSSNTSHKPFFFFIKFYTFHGLSTQSSDHHHCWRLKSVLDFTKFNK